MNSSQFKPDIKLNIAVYHYPQKASEAAIKELLDRILGHMTILRGLHVEGIMISFKDINTLDQKSLLALIEGLVILHTKYDLHMGFGDYTHAEFKVLLQFIRATPISLFKNLEVMALAIGSSRALPYSSVLVYIEDEDEAKSIVSHLISKLYFVVMASSKEDMIKKLKHRELYDRIVIESHFGNLQEEVTVDFDKGIFNYSFQGSMDADLEKSISTRDFLERLKFGYHVYIFDLSNILHMDMHAAYIFVNFLKLATDHKAIICLAGLHKDKLNSNALTIIEKSDFWIFTEKEEVYADVDVKQILKRQHLRIQSQGISERVIKLIPSFIKANKQTLDRMDINDFKSQTKQCVIGAKPDIKPYISTHINYRGDFVGEVNFIFPKDSVDSILSRKHESEESLEKDDHIDALKEFSSTVMGRLKANLEKNNQSIESDFPYAIEYSAVNYDCIEQKYILETFYCNGEPYYVTVTDYIPPAETESLPS